MFYYDLVLKESESKFNWKIALEYLDMLYVEEHSEQIVVTIVGFAWYYFIEGAVESKSYNLESCQIGLDYWKKYLDIGLRSFMTVLFSVSSPVTLWRCMAFLLRAKRISIKKNAGIL